MASVSTKCRTAAIAWIVQAKISRLALIKLLREPHAHRKQTEAYLLLERKVGRGKLWRSQRAQQSKPQKVALSTCPKRESPSTRHSRDYEAIAFIIPRLTWQRTIRQVGTVRCNHARWQKATIHLMHSIQEILDVYKARRKLQYCRRQCIEITMNTYIIETHKASRIIQLRQKEHRS